MAPDSERLATEPPEAGGDWLDAAEESYRKNYASFALSRRCFFCGRDDHLAESEASILSVVVASPAPREDFPLTVTDGWACHRECVASARHAHAPDGPHELLDDETGETTEQGSAKCFFCGQQPDVSEEGASAVLGVVRREAESKITMAWRCHVGCLRAARHPAAPEWRQLDGELLEWDELIAQHGGDTDPYWRKQVAHALWWKAHRLWELGSPEDAVPVWTELARRFGEALESELQRLVRSGLAEQAATLVEMGRHREAQRVFRRLAAGWWAPRRSARVHEAIGWLLTGAVWLAVALRLQGPLGRLAVRLNAKRDARSTSE